MNWENLDARFLGLVDTPRHALEATIVQFVALFFLVAALLFLPRAWFYLSFMFRNLWRNKIRTMLTGLATMILVLVVTLVWTVLSFLTLVTSEKASNLKAIVTERWQIPSQMPYAYATRLTEGAAKEEGDYQIDPRQDSMTWAFYGGTLDPANRTTENSLFFFVMEPDRFLTMIDGIDEFTPEKKSEIEAAIAAMQTDFNKVMVGSNKLRQMNKRVGERIKVTSLNYKDIDIECEIVCELPEGRYEQAAVMSRERLNRALDDYERKNRKPHPMANRSLNLVWLRVPDTKAFQAVERQITLSSEFKSPSVKVETASSGVASFLDAYKDMLWGMRWILVPFILVTMALIIAMAISIGVRERRKEIAVLKVLGFGPSQVLILILGEALLVGGLCGLASSGLTLWFINGYLGGFKFPIAFFPTFMVPDEALWWGPMMGFGTALVGSLTPSLSACRIKVSEVFSRTS